MANTNEMKFFSIFLHSKSKQRSACCIVLADEVIFCRIKNSIADLDPGSGIGFFRIPDPTITSESLKVPKHEIFGLGVISSKKPP